MDERKYVFVGNREYVLKEMIKKDLNIVSVWVIENSYLHNVLKEDLFIKYSVISSKSDLIKRIENTDFDILISNGCKYILPISKLKEKLYINIHPSYLPDLKGKDPINAACLFGRDCGATCHIMDDGIDTGKIISRVRIPITKDLEAAILYQLCFKAEVIAFIEAYKKNFELLSEQPTKEDAIYFSMTPSDRVVQFNKGFDYIIRQAKAFGYHSKGLYFSCNGHVFHFFKSSEVINPFALELSKKINEMQVLFSFENSIVFKFEDRLMRFDQLDFGLNYINEGDYLDFTFTNIKE